MIVQMITSKHKTRLLTNIIMSSELKAKIKTHECRLYVPERKIVKPWAFWGETYSYQGDLHWVTDSDIPLIPTPVLGKGSGLS